ncbi:helix-turn-helix transcriptional regulator [Photobacterium sp. Hal280]|uniref:helix-turn-helix transcriptional regulator n=1 Tax=Photobacterium sp. Hal280 TaxID=3035163 RepID=UPI00301BB124
MSKHQNAKESVADAVARLRANRQPTQSETSGKTLDEIKESTAKQPATAKRASRNGPSLSAQARQKRISQITQQLLAGELTQGQALKALRVSVLGLKQEAYASLVDVSRKTLSEIENDRGSYTTDILNKVFKPFGLKVGLIPLSPGALRALMSNSGNPA